jgi:hypothetical protein
MNVRTGRRTGCQPRDRAETRRPHPVAWVTAQGSKRVWIAALIATKPGGARMPREMAAWLPNRSRRGDEAVAEA